VGPAVPGEPTLLIYGHYDVQPPDPLGEWITPPFEPTVRDGSLYARGAADDKGQVFCLLKAIAAAGRPPVNFRFLIEGEEEFGSKVLFDLIKREPSRVQADVALVADMSYVAPGWPAVYTTLRGLCYAEIVVRTSKTDLHSGEYGGAAPNAHEELARLLTRLKGADGWINIPGFYKAVKRPPKAELAAWKKLPFKEKDFLNKRVQGKALVGIKKYSVLERLWALPTFEIHGILGGFTGEGAKTVIPAEATAKVSMRLVPSQKLAAVEKQLAAAVKRLAPKYVTATVRFLHGADPAQIKVNHPAFKLLDKAFERVTGRSAVRARAGGSIPVVPALALRAVRPCCSRALACPMIGCTPPMRSSSSSSYGTGSRCFARSTNCWGTVQEPGAGSPVQEPGAGSEESGFEIVRRRRRERISPASILPIAVLDSNSCLSTSLVMYSSRVAI
jgi:acetylornithine deacetylase/succinyl-diaminopimelate desuccinylase-like protein